jgi:hypothetical protein
MISIMAQGLIIMVPCVGLEAPLIFYLFSVCFDQNQSGVSWTECTWLDTAVHSIGSQI